MAARSPSPNPSRPTSNNPLLRTPENSLRRSGGSFNLSKSSITAESPQRNSGCLRASFEQKENEREPNCSKTPRAKSPIVSSSKGVKNFMAPTISAASKVIAASPRKKILGERNEVISVFDSLELPAKGEISVKTDTGYDPRTVPNDVISVPNSLEILQKPERGSGTRTVPDAVVVSNVSSAGVRVEEIRTKSEMGSGCRDSLDDPVIKSHKHVAVPTFTPNPALSPLDADPSSQPYDPKSNYLSPRPQFLRYKPNPRFEQYCNKEGELGVGGGKQLDDIFSSESSEEVAESTEAAQSEPEEESCLAKEDAEQFEDRTRISEFELEMKPSGNHPKSRSISWSKALLLLLLVAVGCLYAPLLDSPVLSSSSSILKNFDGLATRFRDWSTDTVAYLSTMASPPKELSSFNLVNLTTFSSLDQTVGSEFIFNTKKTETDWHLWYEMGKRSQMEVSECNDEDREEVEEIHPVYHVESNIEDKVVPEDVREEVRPVENEMESEDEGEFGKELEEVEEITGEEDKEVEYKAVPEDVKEKVTPVGNETELMNEDNCVNELEQERNPSSHNAQNIEEDIKGGEHKEVEYNAVPEDMIEKVHPMENDMESKNEERILSKHIKEEIREEHTTHHGPETVGDQDIQIRSVGSEDSLPGSPEEYEIPKGLESGELSDLCSDVLPLRSMFGVSLAVVVLAASLVFLRMKQNRTTAVALKGFPSKKQASFSGSSKNYNDGKGSSSLHNTPYSGQQNDRRLRRESEASSSISYGSFTTYERVSANKGCRDDEVVTPVRRSSRIRNLVTSP